MNPSVCSLATRLSFVTPLLFALPACASWQNVSKPPPPDIAVSEVPASQSEMLLRHMHRMLAASTRHLHKARTNVHVRRIVCVAEAREIMRSMVSMADQHHIEFLIAKGSRDRVGADDALFKISVAHARVDELHGQTMGCGGPDM